MRKQVADRYAALARLLEFPGRLHETTYIVLAEGKTALEGNRFTVVLNEPRLRVERIDARWSSVHEEEDDPLHSGREVRSLRCERMGGFRGKQRLEAEQPKSRSGLAKEGAAGDAIRRRGNGHIRSPEQGRGHKGTDCRKAIALFLGAYRRCRFCVNVGAERSRQCRSSFAKQRTPRQQSRQRAEQSSGDAYLLRLWASSSNKDRINSAPT